MKITISLVTRWLLAHWADIAKIMQATSALVEELAQHPLLTGPERRGRVVAKLATLFPAAGAGRINVIVELVVSVLRWRKVIK